MKKAQERIIKGMKINAESGCWEWVKCIQANGYGRVTYRYKTQGAHRLAYEAFKGAIPDGMDVCHTCDIPHCVNPEHLFVGTRKANMEDCVAKGRQSKGEILSVKRRGEKHYGSKLTDADVRQIRILAQNGVRRVEIAATFRVVKSTIDKIVSRENWRHI